jgi:hypothetical protein
MPRSRRAASPLPVPAACALLAASLVAAGPAAALTWGVPADAGTVQGALDLAAAGDTVLVSPGTWVDATQHSPVDWVQTHLIMTSGVVLRGATGNPADVILSGADYGRVITCADAAAGTAVEAVTISGGNTTNFGPTDGAGAGLASWNSDLVLRDCLFTDNETGEYNDGGGAGAYILFGHVHAVGCRFAQNVAVDGGGLTLAGATALLEDCLFADNEASGAAGLRIGWGYPEVPSNATVNGCTFEGNRTSAMGTVSVWGLSEADFADCLFLNNEGGFRGGGALRVGDATVTLSHCRFEGNSSTATGGVLYVDPQIVAEALVIMESCTVAGNGAVEGGGAIDVQPGARLEARNTDFTGNAAPLGADAILAAGASATLTCCLADLALWTGDGTVTLVNAGCSVGTESSSWGKLKSLYR